MVQIPEDLFNQTPPRATVWAESQSQKILQHGILRNEQGVKVALDAGVQHADRVRLLFISAIPRPEETDL